MSTPPPEHTYYPAAHMRRRPSSRNPPAPTLENPDNRISLASYHTSGTDRTSRYTTASEGENAKEADSPSINETYSEGEEGAHWTDDDTQADRRDGWQLGGSYDASYEVPSVLGLVAASDYDVGATDTAAQARLSTSGYGSNENSRDRTKARHESVSSQATARPSSFNFRESLVQQSYLLSGDSSAPDADTDRLSLAFPSSAAAVSLGGTPSNRNQVYRVGHPSEGAGGAGAGDMSAPDDDTAPMADSPKLNAPIPDPFSTPPSSLKSGSASYFVDPPELTDARTASKRVSPTTGAGFQTRKPNASYTRGPNPPMTTVTRNRRKSATKAGNGPEIGNTAHGGQGAAAGNGRESAALYSPPYQQHPSHGSGSGSGSYLPPFAPHPQQHSEMSSSSAPAMNASKQSNANGGGSAGFTITPLPPRPGTGSRPGTGTHTPTERETFSSPPMYMPHTPPRGSYLPFATGGGSGTSTPTGSNRSRTSSRVGLTVGNASHGNTVAALAQHVPGLGGTGDGTPYDVNLTRPFTPTGTGMGGDDSLNGGAGGGLGLRTKTALLQGKVEKPWLTEKDWRVKASWWITFSTIMLGFVLSAYACFSSWNSVMLIKQPLCLVMQDDFNSFDVDHDGATWRREVDMSGFGNGEFEMTTSSSNNSFVQDGKLYIVPTLTEDVIGHDNVFNGYTFNITGCTNTDNFHGSACGAVSNQTSHTVINPIMSARLTTQKSHSIRYGRVEIRAKLPRGDWLWPALWMLPVNNTYGPWPQSGEIDIMEARGNSPSYPFDGDNVVRGSLNWGPLTFLNAAFRTFGTFFDRHHRYSDDFHIYALEWTPTFLRTYVDSRLHKTLELVFNEPFFTRGQFPPVIQNGSQTVALQNPWFGRPNSAPFDQPFFLIMNVAVGGTNGWFPDSIGNKPWVDASETAMFDFANAQDKWYPTWPTDPKDRAMVVDYVKMWELC